MAKARLALAIALIAAVGVILALNSVSSESWSFWVARSAMGLLSLFAIAVALLLVSSIFQTKEDLWDTTYFRYMRAFWGSTWGGDGKKLIGNKYVNCPLQISVCRATWLSVITFLFWLCTFAAWLFLFYVTIYAFNNGLDFVSSSPKDNFLARLGILLVLEILLVCLVALFLFVVAWRESFNKAFSKIRGFVFWFIIATLALNLFTVLIVVPVKFAGFDQFATALGLGLGAIIIMGVAGGIIFGFVWLLAKIFKTISKYTVPAVLVKERMKGWKSNMCPLIIKGSGSSATQNR